MSLSPVLLDNTKTQAHPEVLKERVLAAMLAATLGLALVYLAGFAETTQIHNAAHDGRHSASFPCH